MRMSTVRIIRLICLATAIAGFALAASVVSAADYQNGQAPVDSVDATARTITLDGKTYQVPETCRIQTESGKRVPLSEIRFIADTEGKIVNMAEIDYVRYEAIKKRGGLQMVQIMVLDQAPHQ